MERSVPFSSIPFWVLVTAIANRDYFAKLCRPRDLQVFIWPLPYKMIVPGGGNGKTKNAKSY